MDLFNNEVYRSGFHSVLVWQEFDNSAEFGSREYWKWASVFAGEVVWVGHSDTKWQAISDALFRFKCVAGFSGSGLSEPLWLYYDIVDAGLADSCV
jgi:hypothetical protein